MNRSEHLQWCKDQALEYVNQGDASQAMTSMTSDLLKHEETKDHPAISLGMMLMMGGKMNTPQDAEKFINGFN